MTSERFLIVGPAWVGDMVMAQSLFMHLRAKDPGVSIDVVAPGWSAPLIERMDEVGAAHVLEVGHGELGLAARRALGEKLRERGYTRAIVLPRSFKAALVPWYARIPRRTGFLGEMRFVLVNDRRELNKRRLPTTVSRYVALGLEPGEALPEPLPSPTLRVDAARGATLARDFRLDVSRPVVALLPGAEYGPAKQWPAERYALLARRLSEAGIAVLVFGSAKELALGEQICDHSDAVNLCGRTQLADVVDLLGLADVAVSNDSGLMHVAAATGCAVVAIYGSSSPDYTPPLTDVARIMRERQPCSPCFARTCRFGHYRCLTDITVEAVQSAVTQMQGRRRSA